MSLPWVRSVAETRDRDSGPAAPEASSRGDRQFNVHS